ncbi:hypothetical protein [Bradyrhizobium liaoningense]|uniref:hypothetical protein n=1 Tax=Bradyrhizobium liaoningense TaxID=43992 RepID=UPI0012FE587D|nr:hypothetical protein [Bradyrhizobium liaoningense]
MAGTVRQDTPQCATDRSGERHDKRISERLRQRHALLNEEGRQPRHEAEDQGIDHDQNDRPEDQAGQQDRPEQFRRAEALDCGGGRQWWQSGRSTLLLDFGDDGLRLMPAPISQNIRLWNAEIGKRSSLAPD